MKRLLLKDALFIFHVILVIFLLKYYLDDNSFEIALYIMKTQVFIDGNKRIAATLFIYFLQFYNIFA